MHRPNATNKVSPRTPKSKLLSTKLVHPPGKRVKDSMYKSGTRVREARVQARVRENPRQNKKSSTGYITKLANLRHDLGTQLNPAVAARSQHHDHR